MTDIVDKATRSRMMSGIRGKNTKPELVVRKALFAKGLRYRLHDRRLPGKPDIVLPKYQAVIFIHGCFWHGHNCYLFKWPKTRKQFWKRKITRNRIVDKKAITNLRAEGWRVLTLWECSIKGRSDKSVEVVVKKVLKWIKSPKRIHQIAGKR